MPGPVTSGQITDLIVKCDDLGNRLDDHAKAMRRRSNVGTFIGGVGMVVGVVGILLVLGLADHVRDNEHDRAQARTASCIQANVFAEQVRDAVKSSLRSLIPVGTEPSAAQAALFATYNDSVETGLPYRDCTADGIREFFSDPPKDPAGG